VSGPRLFIVDRVPSGRILPVMEPSCSPNGKNRSSAVRSQPKVTSY